MEWMRTADAVVEEEMVAATAVVARTAAAVAHTPNVRNARLLGNQRAPQTCCGNAKLFCESDRAQIVECLFNCGCVRPLDLNKRSKAFGVPKPAGGRSTENL